METTLLFTVTAYAFLFSFAAIFYGAIYSRITGTPHFLYRIFKKIHKGVDEEFFLMGDGADFAIWLTLVSTNGAAILALAIFVFLALWKLLLPLTLGMIPVIYFAKKRKAMEDTCQPK